MRDLLGAVRVLAPLLGIGAAVSAGVHDQDNLPPGEEGRRDHYLRLHSAKVREGVEGWSRLGKRRIVTGEAWARELKSETARTRTRKRAPLAIVPPQRDYSSEFQRELGIKITK